VRDPIGRVEVSLDGVLRHAFSPLPEPHFLDTSMAAKLVSSGLLNAGEGRATAASIQIISFAKFLGKNMLGKKLQDPLVTEDIDLGKRYCNDR